MPIKRVSPITGAGPGVWMQLTAQQLSEIVEGLRTGGKSGNGAERRRCARMEVQARIAAATMAGGKVQRGFTVLTRDISFTGIGLMQAVSVEKGGQMLVRLPVQGRSLVLMCDVMHVSSLADGVLGVGAEFAAEVNEEFAEQMARASEREMQRIRESILA